MSIPDVRPGATVLALLLLAPAAHSASTLYSFSNACGNGYSPNCTSDYRFGDPAVSSVSRPESYSSPGGGGYNYGAEARAAANSSDFALYALAGGGTFEPNYAGGPGQFGMSATAQVQYHDEVTIAGSGFGTIVVPWRASGSFDIYATSGDPYAPAGNFGVPFCQSIVTGNNSGGMGCTGGGTDTFSASTGYDRVWLLEYVVQFGVTYSLNTTFNLAVGSGVGLTVGATADFSHTGLQQAASVHDSYHNLVANPVITAASGVDYLNPQVSSVPALASLGLLATGILGIAWRAAKRAMKSSGLNTTRVVSFGHSVFSV